MSISLEHLPALLRITQETLATRVLVFVALLMSFGLFCWAMVYGDWPRLLIAATFALIVFLPILLRKETSDGHSG
jgi:hypothetical protein